MKRELLFSLLAMAVVWTAACPRRHVAPRVVYVPTERAQASSSQPASGTLVVQEPPPPPPPSPPSQAVPAEPQEEEPSEPQTSEHRRARPRPRPDENGQPAQPAGEVPTLELGGSSAQQAARERSLAELQRQIRQRIGRLKGQRLPESTRKTVDEAGSFLSQSETALKQGDPQRAENLAHKAELLLEALERH